MAQQYMRQEEIQEEKKDPTDELFDDLYNAVQKAVDSKLSPATVIGIMECVKLDARDMALVGGNKQPDLNSQGKN